jgi:hypothetical protein
VQPRRAIGFGLALSFLGGLALFLALFQNPFSLTGQKLPSIPLTCFVPLKVVGFLSF